MLSGAIAYQILQRENPTTIPIVRSILEKNPCIEKDLAALLSRFSSSSFTELDHAEPGSWAKESYEIAIKIAYQNGSLRGTPKDRPAIAGMFLR